MARNTGEGYRIGEVRDRSQFQLPNGDWMKRNTEDGRFMDRSENRFKGVRREHSPE
jgi:hypothetical protein